MECKSIRELYNSVCGSCINRNIVECKSTKHWLINRAFLVLIETLWNVNNGESIDVFTPADVLIETLWNVNKFAKRTLWTSENRINRNIVECKWIMQRYRLWLSYVLIETLWNVNVYEPYTGGQPSPVLIETLWNVNITYDSKFLLQTSVLIETLWNVNRIPTQLLWHLPSY